MNTDIGSMTESGRCSARLDFFNKMEAEREGLGLAFATEISKHTPRHTPPQARHTT